MSILDGKLFFADDVAVSSGGLLGDVINTFTSSLREEFYHGEPVWWVNLVTSAPSADTFSFPHFVMFGGVTEYVSGEPIIQSTNFALEDLKAGTYWNVILPLSNVPLPRYIGAALGNSGDDLVDMRVTSYLTITPPSFGWEKTKDWRP